MAKGALVLALGGPKDESEGGGDDARLDAFRAFKKAMSKGDDAAGLSAFEALMDACDDYDKPKPEADDESSDDEGEELEM